MHLKSHATAKEHVENVGKSQEGYVLRRYEGARAIDVTWPCEEGREKLRKNHGKVMSLPTAQENVTFGFVSNKLA